MLVIIYNLHTKNITYIVNTQFRNVYTYVQKYTLISVELK